LAAATNRTFRTRIQEFRERIQREGFGGGFGGTGRRHGRRPIAIGRIGGRGFNINQPTACSISPTTTRPSTPLLFRSVDFPSPSRQYNQSHFGANAAAR